MNKFIDISGRTIDIAIDAALVSLQLDRDSVNVEILEQPKSGFFGIGRSGARVRVHYEETGSSKAEVFLNGLLKHMNVEATTKLEENQEGRVDIKISGNDMGVIIGRRGDTLDAIQYVTNLVVNKGEEKHTRITVDTENYRAKREESLERLAQKLAGKVVKYKKNMTLEPMNPHERRIIHSTLQGTSGISTYSTGADPNRRVVIAYTPLKRAGDITAPPIRK